MALKVIQSLTPVKLIHIKLIVVERTPNVNVLNDKFTSELIFLKLIIVNDANNANRNDMIRPTKKCGYLLFILLVRSVKASWFSKNLEFVK